MTLRLRVIYRQAIMLAVVLALVLTIAVPAAMAQSASPTTSEPPACPAPVEPLASGPVVVQGWVINHRELTVDGTRTASALQINAVSSAGTTVSAPVASNGYFKLTLVPDVWNFSLQLPVRLGRHRAARAAWRTGGYRLHSLGRPAARLSDCLQDSSSYRCDGTEMGRTGRWRGAAWPRLADYLPTNQ